MEKVLQVDCLAVVIKFLSDVFVGEYGARVWFVVVSITLWRKPARRRPLSFSRSQRDLRL